jgi:hypothetical protein
VRSNTLLFLHVLVAMVVVGGLLACVVATVAARRTPDERGALYRSLAWRFAVGTVVATLVAIVLGESLSGQEDVEGTWLDVSRGLAMGGLLIGGVALAILARYARGRPRLANPVLWLAFALVLIGLAVAFVMAAKPS